MPWSSRTWGSKNADQELSNKKKPTLKQTQRTKKLLKFLITPQRSNIYKNSAGFKKIGVTAR